ncbi:MAG: hypothetical protein WBQ17_06410 [Rhizomicrobium sp.]
MPLIEDAKKIAERVTGVARPGPRQIKKKTIEPRSVLFKESGQTPNNDALPFLHYKGVILLDERFDPAAVFEVLFVSNGWKDSWRNGIYPFLHFHTKTHEVLGIAKGHTSVQFAGAEGPVLKLYAGDVVVLPAGTGHERQSASDDLLVVGAYPAGGKYNEPKPGDVELPLAHWLISRVPLPKKDPVFGASGPLRKLWLKKGRR